MAAKKCFSVFREFSSTTFNQLLLRVDFPSRFTKYLRITRVVLHKLKTKTKAFGNNFPDIRDYAAQFKITR